MWLSLIPAVKQCFFLQWWDDCRVCFLNGRMIECVNSYDFINSNTIPNTLWKSIIVGNDLRHFCVYLHNCIICFSFWHFWSFFNLWLCQWKERNHDINHCSQVIDFHKSILEHVTHKQPIYTTLFEHLFLNNHILDSCSKVKQNCTIFFKHPQV